MDVEPEKFEVAIRIMGNEILAFSLKSDSPRKTWVAISVITFAVILLLLADTLPALIGIISSAS
jgi:hypothetical protein